MLLCHLHAILSLKKFQFFFSTTPHKFVIFFCLLHVNCQICPFLSNLSNSIGMYNLFIVYYIHSIYYKSIVKFFYFVYYRFDFCDFCESLVLVLCFGCFWLFMWVCCLGLLFVHGPLCKPSEKIFCKVEGGFNCTLNKNLKMIIKCSNFKL